MLRSEGKAFVAVKAKYYKYQAALAILDHNKALRNGFTSSANVHQLFTSENQELNRKGCSSALQALERACIKYKSVTGKKIRSDFNVLFEHVVVLSESHYAFLERKYGKAEVKRKVLKNLAMYARKIKQTWGFEPLGVSLHLDEGFREQNGRFVRNVHAHISFFNYDFQKKIAPLRHMMKKGKGVNGRTNSFNENFVEMQDIAACVFANLGFKRGESQSVTGTKHLNKEEFVKSKLKHVNEELTDKSYMLDTVKQELKNVTSVKLALTSEIDALNEEKGWLLAAVDKLKSDTINLERAFKKRSLRAIHTLVSQAAKVKSYMKKEI